MVGKILPNNTAIIIRVLCNSFRYCVLQIQLFLLSCIQIKDKRQFSMPSTPYSCIRIAKYSLLTLVLLAVLSSCANRREVERASVLREELKPDTLSILLKFDNSLFPLPSPYQAALLIKRHNFQFDEGILNPLDNAQRYTTSFKKALNLGVYGTNLSYLNIYDRTPQSISYLSTIKKLSEELNLGHAFSHNIYKQLETNMGKRDSILMILGRTFREADSYLKVNDRSYIGALILTGGWVESLYILTQISKNNLNREIINRIGEQKHPLDNLLEVLTPYYYKSPEFSGLIDKLIDLAYEFDGIIYSYSYREPKIDVENKMIYINSESRVIMSEYHLQAITQRIEAIRSAIIE